jgi:hypothetical protein
VVLIATTAALTRLRLGPPSSVAELVV